MCGKYSLGNTFRNEKTIVNATGQWVATINTADFEDVLDYLNNRCEECKGKSPEHTPGCSAVNRVLGG